MKLKDIERGEDYACLIAPHQLARPLKRGTWFDTWVEHERGLAVKARVLGKWWGEAVRYIRIRTLRDDGKFVEADILAQQVLEPWDDDEPSVHRAGAWAEAERKAGEDTLRRFQSLFN
jgi:hypothetical protein